MTSYGHVVRVSVRVYPGSRRAGIGGRYGSGEPPVLIVRVTARAVDGRANEAVIEAIATAFSVPARRVRVLVGLHRRDKLLEVLGGDPETLDVLLDPDRCQRTGSGDTEIAESCTARSPAPRGSQSLSGEVMALGESSRPGRATLSFFGVGLTFARHPASQSGGRLSGASGKR
jgi:uncharacterized protein YggU (UPF0235/DUF167 family)